MKTPTMASQEAAEMLAIQALAFLAEEPARLNGFLSTTGLELGNLRDAAREPRFLAGVLDHMLSDETLLVAFADSAGINPAGIEKARRALGGHWERDLP